MKSCICGGLGVAIKIIEKVRVIFTCFECKNRFKKSSVLYRQSLIKQNPFKSSLDLMSFEALLQWQLDYPEK